MACPRLIAGDRSVFNSIEKYFNYNIKYEDMKLKIESNLKSKYAGYEEIIDAIVSSIFIKAEEIAKTVVTIKNKRYNELDRKIDDILTSKIYGIPIMLIFLGLIFWITISGANYPSAFLAKWLFYVEDHLTEWSFQVGVPSWLHGVLIQGMYRTMAWVISVMLPPMAIFFPLFTLLEDCGYLPRIAFNLDNFSREQEPTVNRL